MACCPPTSGVPSYPFMPTGFEKTFPTFPPTADIFPSPMMPMSPMTPPFKLAPSWPNTFFPAPNYFYEMPPMMMPWWYQAGAGFGGQQPPVIPPTFPMMPSPFGGSPILPYYYYSDIEREMRERARHYEHKRAAHMPSTSMVHLPSRPSSALEYYTFQNPVRVDANGNRWLSLAFDLSSFKPEEINVTLYTTDKYIEVHAAHDHAVTGAHAIKRSYDRKYYFPADLMAGDVSKLELRSYLSNEGQLFVEALLPALSREEMEKLRMHYPVTAAPVKVEKKEI